MLFWALALLPIGLALSSPLPDRIQVQDAVNPPLRCTQERSGFGRALALPDAVYCSNLARGYGALRVNPQRALQLAQAAFAQHPEVASRLLMARAQVALEAWEPAWVNFEAVLTAVHVGALSTPALHDWGMAAALTGHDLAALEAYRRLLPQLETLSPGRRARAPLEAALAALRVSSAFVGEARAAVNLSLRYRAGRTSRGLGLAILRVADELEALSGVPPLPRAQQAEAWPDLVVLQAQRPVVPAQEAALLEWMLQSDAESSGVNLRWQDLAQHPNAQWRALALHHLRDSK